MKRRFISGGSSLFSLFPAPAVLNGLLQILGTSQTLSCKLLFITNGGCISKLSFWKVILTSRLWKGLIVASAVWMLIHTGKAYCSKVQDQIWGLECGSAAEWGTLVYHICDPVGRWKVISWWSQTLNVYKSYRMASLSRRPSPGAEAPEESSLPCCHLVDVLLSDYWESQKETLSDPLRFPSGCFDPLHLKE